VLFPERDVRAFTDELRAAGVDCLYGFIESSHGHDSFLAEPDKLTGLLKQFLAEISPAPDSFRAVEIGSDGDIA
jgi:homoserine acetyltransferase